MILYVGDEISGYFIKEVAAMRKEPLEYIEASLKIEHQVTEILRKSPDYLIIAVEQYAEAVDVIAEEIRNIARAKNTTIIIHAPGYDPESKMIRALKAKGIQYFLYSGSAAGAREELERALEGYYLGPDPEELEPEILEQEERKGKKIGVVGACKRMGTTTAAIQLLQHLQLRGYRACYIEMNPNGFVQAHERNFECIHDAQLGKVQYQDVDLYYKQEHLVEILSMDYDYYVYDYGTYQDRDFNKTSFLEKDLRIFVMGSKASEMEAVKDVLRNEYYTDAFYLFNFISDKEKVDLLEFMMDRARQTFFMEYAPDQFEYVPNESFDQMLPVEDLSQPEEPKKKRFRLFGR